MQYWLIADTHIDCQSMICSGSRPADFTQQILANWAKCVKAEDTVLHLGDAAYDDCGLGKLLDLPGRKILIRGNHDKLSTESYMRKGFVLCCDELIMEMHGLRILFTHKPRYEHTCDINIHGHRHDVYQGTVQKLMLPIALETMGYAPIPMNQRFWKYLDSWAAHYWRSGIQPEQERICAIGQMPIRQLREQDLYGNLPTDSHKARRYRRDIIERFMQSEDYQQHNVRSVCHGIAREYIDARIDLEEARERLQACLAKERARWTALGGNPL